MENKKSFVIRYTATMCMLLGVIIWGTGCRNEPAQPKEKIESIEFDKERVVIKINEETTVKVKAKSDAAKKNEKIAYTSVNDGVIEIREPTNDGFIVKGLRYGSTVITAKSQLVTSYFEVVVEGENITAQYITVAQPVIEMLEGERRSTQVSLYGGSILDNNDFVWRLENGKDNIGIDVTANIAVVSALQRGHQKIIVSHPKSEYESEILVFVRGVDEEIHYISCQSNVVLVPNDGQYHDFSVILVNGKPEDIINFEYEVTEGGGNIEIVANGNVCNVLGIKSGTSVIRITHPLAVVEFDVRIIVYDIDIPFIVLEQTFLLMNIGESVSIGATVEYARNGVLSNNEFSYEIIENNIVVKSDNSIVEVVQNNHHFYIRARRGGSARIVISNEQAEMSHEILIVVREEVIFRDDYYITTSQNVIMTQVGADAVQLNMQLVNGNSGDANGFEWTVDDGTLITVESGHGIVRGNRAAINSVFNAIAIITPKKSGTAKITLYHPKSEVTATVMVKVYPKGTFAEIPVLVGCEGLIKVKSGAPDNDPDKSPKTVQLHMVSGDILDVGNLDWSTEQPGIATVNTGAHGVVNILSAAGNGLTKMAVNGPRLQFPHESLVLAGTPEYVDNSSVIYVDSIYQRLLTEQVVRIEVKDSQGLYGDSNGFKVEVENKNVLYAVMIKNQLVLQGKEAGETKVIVAHEDSINTITLNVYVDQSNVSISHPYYISGPEIKGVVRGWMYDDTLPNLQSLKVTLVGAGESETSKLKWVIEDSNVATITPSGGTCWIQGKISNRQTKIKVSHPKAQEEKVIILYVVENESDLYNKVALGLHSENYLLTKGEERLITLITNASESQKLGLRWKIRNEMDGVMTNNVITLDPHYDSAMIRANGAGNAEIVVTHDDNILPLSIYVSVVEALSGEKVIKGPAVIELIRGEGKIVSVSHNNLSPVEVSNIRWSVEDSSLVNIQENGDSAYMLGLKKGVSYVNIRQDGIGYKHRATLLCANTPEELAAMYVMGVDSSYHTMIIGEEKRIKLSFGSAGFPEAAKSTIKWTADKTGVVRVVGQGESVTVVAANEGIGKVTVESNASFNSLELTFEVRGNKANVYEFRGHEKIKGIVVGDTARITMRIYDGDTEITSGYSLLEYENENNNIIGINTVDNIIDITAKAAGQSYIIARHKQVNDPARILVYTANTLEELDRYYPILIEKTNYLLQVGESAAVKIETIESKDAENFRNISWGIENASVIENADFNGKKEVVIKGRAEGQCIINISYQGNVVARIFITVVGNDAVDMTKYIVTENIIGLVKGEPYTTKIFSNLGADVSSVVWDTTDSTRVSVNGSGENGTLLGVNTGEAYVTVSYGSWLKRHILVYVCDTKAQVGAYKAMNMENQYYRAGLNETLILPVYYAPNKTTVPTLWIDKYDNKVVRFNALDSGGKLEITTLNEGVAVLEAVNTDLSNSNGVLRIYIEVSKRYNNAPKTPEIQYLTIGKTVYVMNPDDVDVPLDLSVSGIGMTVDELAKVKWEIESGSMYVNIYPNGKDCKVMVNRYGYEGQAKLKAYYVDNIVEVMIIVSRTGLVGFPHIVGEEIIRVGLGANVFIEYDVAEISTYNKNLFYAEVRSGSDYASAVFTGNKLEVEGKKSGQALVRISCPNVCEYYKEVIIIVTTTPDGHVYLTTNDNFTQVKKDETKTLEVQMIGFDNAGDQGYDWKVNTNHRSYIDFQFTGRQAQVRGLEAGEGKTAEIVITNEKAEFSLSVYVRVSNAEINTTYIKIQRNIVSVVEGHSVYLEAELVNGKPGSESLFTWESLNKSILQVEGAGSQVIVFGKSVGIGRVQVGHKEAVNGQVVNGLTGTEILVIVEKDTTSEGIYITTDSTLVDIRPNDTRQLSVMLVGGNPEDVRGFLWTVPPELNNSVDKILNEEGEYVSQQVINLAPGQDRAYITGIREGEATVRVTHPRTNYVLDIKVYVRHYSTIKFSQQSVIVEVGEEETITVMAPGGINIFYSASRDIVNITGTNRVCRIEGKTVGVCIVTAYNANGTMSDEIIVEVKPSTKRVTQYIQTNDLIFNMTDWYSALNRVMITGTTVGEKENGLEFMAKDDESIIWKITKGADLISFGDGIEDKLQDKGKGVSVYTKGKPGSEPAVITLTHPDMPNYSKEVYINVSSHDMNFVTEPKFISMHKLEKGKTIEADLRNLVEKDFSEISWKVKPNEKKVNGVRIYKSSHYNNGKSDIPVNYTGEILGKTVYLEALEPGVFEVEAKYNNSSPLRSFVYVEQPRSLEILGESFIKILPGHVRYIGYIVEPANADVIVTTDYLEFLDKQEGIKSFSINDPGFEQYSSEINFNVLDNSKANGFIRIKGGERDGYTKITLKSNNIQRMVTVNTNHDYMFYMKGVIENGTLRETTVVRGKPGQTVVVEYDINPKYNAVRPVTAEEYYFNGLASDDPTKIIVTNIGIDSDSHRITLKLDKCGYSKLQYVSAYNGPGGIRLEIPVYIYYDRIDLVWTGRSQNIPGVTGSLKSRLDNVSNAVYIADGEKLTVSFNKQASGDPAGYDGTRIAFVSESFTPRYGFVPVNGSDPITVNGDRDGTSIVFTFTNSNRITAVSSDSLLKVGYVGQFELTYGYYTGGEERNNTFKKTFMVYAEQWARK
jgi:hypothetical protein